MCAISRLVFACSITALCGVVSETNATLSGQDLQGGNNITRETNNSLNQPQLKDSFSKFRSTFYGSISDILRFNPRLTIGAEVSGEVTNRSGYNISEASSGPKQYYHDQDSRIGYNVLESLYPRPVNPNRRKRIRGRRRREARTDQAALTAESTPSVKILVRVRRKQTRRPDFTQLNKDVCPPSLCRVFDERSRGVSGRPRGTGGTVFYQGDIVLDSDLDRIIYPSTTEPGQSLNRKRGTAEANKRSGRRRRRVNQRNKRNIDKTDTSSRRQTSQETNGGRTIELSARTRIQDIVEISKGEGQLIQNETGVVESRQDEAEKLLNKLKSKVVWRMQERSGRKRRATMKRRNRLWKNGVVVFKMGRQIRPVAKRMIQRAMKHIEQKTCIKFREKKDSDVDFIRFISEPGCWSQVGRVGGSQQVSLGRGCEYLGTAVHEIVHSLGVWHEQARPDRDRFVKILEDNISERFLPDFEAVGQLLVTDRGYPYDYQSLMHYSQYAFTRNGEPTIQVIGIGKRLNLRIGQERGLSTIDIAQLRDMYKCNQKQDWKETACHKGWKKHLSSCYKFVTSSPAQFDVAHQACKREKANLVVIENSREQWFINKVLSDDFSNITRWRTAGRQVEKDMVWYLDEKRHKEICSYEKWARGQPATKTSLVLYRDPRSGHVRWLGEWAKDTRAPNRYRYPFICEKPAKRKCVELRYGDGRDYRGHLDHTREGYTCQRWTENYPHDHPLVKVSREAAAWTRTASKGSNNNSTRPERFRDGLGTHNKCRNPSGLRRNRPWCYTTKRRHEWGYCDVSPCAGFLKRSAQARLRSASSRRSSVSGNPSRRGTARDLSSRQRTIKQTSPRRGGARRGTSRQKNSTQRSPNRGNSRRKVPRRGSTSEGITERRKTRQRGPSRPARRRSAAKKDTLTPDASGQGTRNHRSKTRYPSRRSTSERGNKR